MHARRSKLIFILWMFLLGPGQRHILCLQATDGEDRVLEATGMTQELEILVVE